MTGDRDMYQCAGERVTVLYVKTGGGKGAEEVGPAEVRERYGIDPELVPDFIALRGDPSDGLPGAKGVGPKTAAELLRRHGSLEAILDNAIREPRPKLRGALLDAREELLAFKDIATLRDAGVEPPPDRATDWAGAAAAARERGMNRLAERLEAKPARPERGRRSAHRRGATSMPRQRYSGWKSKRQPASHSVRWLPWAGMPPASLSIRARCSMFQAAKVVLRLVKSFSGPPEPSSR